LARVPPVPGLDPFATRLDGAYIRTFRAGLVGQRRCDSKKDTTRIEIEENCMQFESERKLRMLCAILALGGSCGVAIGDEVTDRTKNPDLWADPGGDQALTRHSSLKNINTTNVHGLQMVWSQSSGTLRGHEGQPLVVDLNGTPMMYMESGWPNIIQALDLTDPDHPKEIWNYTKTTDRDQSAVPRACCDTVNRGMSFADGKLVFGTLDGFVIALDAKTGKEIWVVKHAYPAHGETITPAPLIAEGKVIIGFGGDEFAARGALTAYDLGTGKKDWSFFSTGTDKDVGLTAETNKKHPEYGKSGSDVGIHSYPGDEWKRGGGALWGFYSYDPELKLVYASSGNPGLWSPSYRCGAKTHEECNNGKWDNKWSMTIFCPQGRHWRGCLGLSDDTV
jgi:PQQ-dependent dehydrogenase (methanol/ethanol family)